MLSSLKQSESATSIEHLKIYNMSAEPSGELIEEHAQFIEMSSALKKLHLREYGLNFNAGNVVKLLTALN